MNMITLELECDDYYTNITFEMSMRVNLLMREFLLSFRVAHEGLLSLPY